MTMTRRELVHTLGAAGGAGWLGQFSPAAGSSAAPDDTADRTVYLNGDGVPLSPRAFTALLHSLTQQADVVVVVGAPESSNSNRLVELAAKSGARAHLVQDADDVRPEWLEGARCVGVTAGASAPEVLVEGVVARIARIAGGDVAVRSLPEVDEGIVFQLPSELR